MQIVEHDSDRLEIADTDIDALRNVCRCGTCPRIREAIIEAAAEM